MKMFGKLAVSVAMGALCVWFVVRRMDTSAVWTSLGQIGLRTVLIYLATLAVTHFFRAWRWEYLLRPIGVTLPLPRLLSISSVGFMAILALPVRLGEFIRPYFVVRDGHSRMSAILGTVAVERIVDGLLISVLFFGSYLASDASSFSAPLKFAAWASLLGFFTLTVFLLCALRWTDTTIRVSLALTLLPRLRPALAEKIAEKLRSLIQGFQVLRDPKNLLPFLLQSLLYWGSNGFGMWLLANDMHLHLSLAAAFATMAFTGVVISLPNAPGNVGQFHAGIVLGLAAYLPESVVNSAGGAYAIVLHGLQTIWYVGVGLLFLKSVAGTKSLRSMVQESNQAGSEGVAG